MVTLLVSEALASLSALLEAGKCPVSSSLDVRIDGRYGYPMEYLSSRNQLIIQNNSIYFETFNCSSFYSFDRGYVGTPDLCPVAKKRGKKYHRNLLCPIDNVQLNSATVDDYVMELSNQLPFLNIAQSIKAHMHNKNGKIHKLPKRMNIYVLGGSMTDGSSTDCKCLCYKSRDRKCTASLSPKDEHGERCSSRMCSWVAYFKNWVEKFSNNYLQIKLILLAKSGQSTTVAAATIVNQLAGVRITSNDLFLLDHSVNDAVSVRSNDLKNGLELLIRRIFSLSDIGRPSVVLVEQFLFGNLSIMSGKHRAVDTSNNFDYGTTYRVLSEHYKLPIWSVRRSMDTYGTYNGTGGYKFPAYHPLHLHTHPPYVQHLYAADVLSAVFVSTVKRCLSDVVDLDVKYEVPKPLFVGDDNNICTAKSRYIIYAPATAKNSPLPSVRVYENSASAKAAGWRQYVDSHNVPGWIITKVANMSKNQLDFAFHSINQHAKPKDWSQRLSYIHRNVTMMKEAHVNLSALTLTFTYIHSHSNYGAVVPYICNRRIPSIPLVDALQHDVKFTLPHTIEYKFTEAEAEACSSLPANDRKIRFEYMTKGLTSMDKRGEMRFKLCSLYLCTNRNV